MQFFSYLINGISLGSVYALIALGYTMVYGIAKMLNFAHGDVIMIGSYVVYFAFGASGLNPVLSIVAVHDRMHDAGRGDRTAGLHAPCVRHHPWRF